MHPNPMVIAYGGVALAAAAVVMLFLVAFFGDLFLKSNHAFRRWMDTIMWCMVGGLLATAWSVAQFHH